MRKLVLIITGVFVIMGLGGCGSQKYELNFDGYGFESEKTSYAEGEEVTVYYDMIATDTDYSFYCDDDVDMDRDYDDRHGYIFTFTMPAHDVTIRVESRNTMEYDPGANLPEPPADLASEIDPDNMEFDYYEAVVATVGGDGYSEYVLYERDEGAGMILARYTKHEYDEEETMSCCLVPAETWDHCMNIVRNYDMASWKDGMGLNGMRYVVRFPDPQGEMMRVSSDDMPENGLEAFGYIEGILTEAWSEYKTTDAPADADAPDDDDTAGETWFCPECGQKNNGKYCMDCGFKKPENP